MPETNTQNNTPNTPADATSAAADTNTAQTQETTPTADSGAQEPKPENTAAEQSAQTQEPELTIDSYKELDSFDPEYELDAESMKAFKEVGLKNKIPPAALKAVAEWSLGEVKKQQEAFAKQKEAWREENAKKYGDNLKNVKTNVGRVLADFDKSGEFAKVLQSAGVEDNPAALEFLAAVGDAVLEKGSVNPNASAEGKDVTLEDMYK